MIGCTETLSNMKRIKYISYYDRVDAPISRNYTVSAINKMNYIISSLNKVGIYVDIVSMSGCICDKFYYDKGGLQNWDGNTLKHFSSFGPTNIAIVRLMSRYWQMIHFFIWFILNVTRGEKVLIYHSLGYCQILTLLKKLKKCIYIGEIEEIYQDVKSYPQSLCKCEYTFINICDKYVFPTHLLSAKINLNNKPYIVVHGTYKIERRRNVSWNDSDIHVVYAGTFDPNKGGAYAAVEAANYLPENYHIHICGFGTKAEVVDIKEAIKDTVQKSYAKVTYEGMLQGEDFIELLQKCQIGLSTQDPQAAFNDTSFPSKILTYLTNGLSVASIRIPVVETSDVSSCVVYYDKQTPEAIATAVKSVQYKDLDELNNLLGVLDNNFKRNILEIIQL